MVGSSALLRACQDECGPINLLPHVRRMSYVPLGRQVLVSVPGEEEQSWGPKEKWTPPQKKMPSALG